MKGIISTFAYASLVTIVAFSMLEVFLRTVGGYYEVTSGQTDCKLYNEKYAFSSYKQDCWLKYKHWEQKEEIEYVFNQYGRREPPGSSAGRYIAFVGDSFTMGAMVPINKNYNYVALSQIEPKYDGHNYGVGGAQFHDVLARLKYIPVSEYEHIVYGLTPNDLFDIVDGTAPGVDKGAEESHRSNESEIAYRDLLVTTLRSTATVRFLLHNLMAVDSMYYEVYMQRKPYSGYLEKPVSKPFIGALDLVFAEIAALPQDIVGKLIIVLLPQRADVVAMRIGESDQGFQNEFHRRCSTRNLSCVVPSLSALAELDSSHFVIDGHLTADGNASVGRDLADYFNRELLADQ